jgi:pSer/pThr/pTyr-binding forkhead associated (FHA) protein
MRARVVIYHLAGSKPNQVEEFAVDAFAEITIGRNPGATIRFDAAGDDGVSPNHARITVSGDPPRLLLSDCGSHYGTLLNGNKIATENETSPRYEMELGLGVPLQRANLSAGWY